MDQTDGMDVHFRGVEAISHKVMAKRRKLRQMSGFGPILDEEVAFYRPSPPNHVNHLHHDLPMDPTEGLNRYIWGVEAISPKIMAKHCVLRRMSDSGPILGEEVAFSRPSLSNHVNHLHHDPPMDLTEGLKRYIWGVEATSHKITAENLIFADFRFRAPSAADFVLS